MAESVAIAWPPTSASIPTAAITVTAFVPLFTMQGVEGQIFGPMARTYGYALAGALLATFTVTPVLAALVLPKRIEETETIIVRALRSTYTPVLQWALSRTRIAVLLGIAFLLLSVGAASRLGSEFLPQRVFRVRSGVRNDQLDPVLSGHRDLPWPVGLTRRRC